MLSSFIALPGVGTLPTDEWKDKVERDYWLKDIGNHDSEDICIYTYENELAADGTLCWQRIEEEGAEFWGALQSLTQIQEVSGQSLVRSRFSILSSNFADTIPFLDMALSICDQLQQKSVPRTQQDIALNDQLENLLSKFHHHREELSLHTDQPKLSLSSYNSFIDMLHAKIGDEVRGKDQSLGLAFNRLFQSIWRVF